MWTLRCFGIAAFQCRNRGVHRRQPAVTALVSLMPNTSKMEEPKSVKTPQGGTQCCVVWISGPQKRIQRLFVRS